jgi:hypothetical protein
MKKEQTILIISCLTLLIFLMVTPASALGPWSLYGTAASVKEGQRPNRWAIETTSDCPPGPVICFENDTFTYGGIEFRHPNRKLTFKKIYRLATDYAFKQGDCAGGSPRFSIAIDMDGDGDFTQPEDGHVFVYIGEAPNFDTCETGWQNTGNLISSTDSRFDTSQVGGSFYDTYDNALELVGDKRVVYVSLDLDGGWIDYQEILFDNVAVNNFTLRARGFMKK